jgi:hypothetical protein
MKQNENDSVWISQKMYTYQDPASSIQMQMNFEIGIFPDEKWNTYCSPRVAIQLKDKRFQNQKVQIELHYAELNALVVKIEKAIEKGIENVFKSGSTISVIKFYAQSRKDMVMLFGVDDKKPIIHLKITDPTSSSGTLMDIVLDYQAFSCIYNFCRQAREQYIVTTSTFLNIAMQERILKQLCSMTDSIDQLKAQMKIMPSRGPVSLMEDVDITCGASDIAENIAMEMQKVFENTVNIDEQVVEGLDEFSEIPETIAKTKNIGSLQFIGGMLGYDPMKLGPWVSSFLCANDTANPTAFCPLNSIIMQCTESPKVAYSNHWLEAQYFMTCMMRKSVKSYLSTGKFLQFPVYVLPKNEQFQKGSSEYELAKEIILTLLIYTVTTSNYLKYIRASSIEQSKINEINITKNFLTGYLISLALSMKVDPTELKSELLDVLNQCYSNGFIDNLNTVYSGWTLGGKIDFSQKVMDTVIDRFMEALPKISTFSDNETDEGSKVRYKKYGIHQFGQITSEYEVKLCVLKELGFEKEIEEKDPRLDLFVECSKKYVDPMFLQELNAVCKKYVDLELFFREKNIPLELIRIKRVMDKDSELNKRSDVLRLVRELEEDPLVSETRTMFESGIAIDDEPISEDLEKILFGID